MNHTKIVLVLITMNLMVMTVNAESLSGHVYAGNASSAFDKTYPLHFVGTTQEYYKVNINNAYTQFTQIHTSPNFFYFSCIGLASSCVASDPTGGEVFVDEFDVSGSQVGLQVHTPWDSWVDTWVDRDNFLIVTYSGSDPNWVNATYTIYVKTFVGAYFSGVTLKIQLVVPNNPNPSYFYNPQNVGNWTTVVQMPYGFGSLSNNKSKQEIIVNTQGINTTDINTYRFRVLASEIIPFNGGSIKISDPYIPLLQEGRNFKRMTGIVNYTTNSLTMGAGSQWYDLTGFTTSLQANSLFSVGISSNVQIEGLELIVTYNTSTAVPLRNVLIRGLAGFELTSSSATTNDSGYYNISILNSETEILFNGFYSFKAGNRFYGSQNTSTFAGGDIQNWNVFLDESVNNNTGSLAFAQNTSSVAIGQSMNISYVLYHPDIINNEYRIDMYKPVSDFSYDMVFDTSMLVVSEGYWIPDNDKTIQGVRNFYLNYTVKTGGASITLDVLMGTYGNIDAIGNISTDKTNYNISDNITINYSTTVNGRIIVYSDQNGFYSIYDVNIGDNQTLIIPITSSFVYGKYVASLQYNQYAEDWATLDQAQFSIIPGSSTIKFENTEYSLGQSITMNVYQTTNGHLILEDSNNVQKINLTGMNVGNFSFNVYFTQFSDPTGTWTAKLYNVSNLLVSTDTTLITLFNATPTPTPGGYEECPSGADFCAGVPMKRADVWFNLWANLPSLGYIIILVLILSAIIGTYQSWGRK